MDLLVGGTFDNEEGKPSGYIKKLHANLLAHGAWGCLNGGNFDDLTEVADTRHDALLWFPNVPNDLPKLVGGIKAQFPKTLLVISKNNLEGTYPFWELLGRALLVKANLFVEFSKGTDGISAAVCDPLGNRFCNTTDIEVVAKTLARRILELKTFTRMPSFHTVPVEADGSMPMEVIPSVPEGFLELIRDYAEVYHHLIFPASSTSATRFMGNASFRCESGFPSFRSGDDVYVTRRNVDKRGLTAEGFVPVKLSEMAGRTAVFYRGENKPSVDTPVQLRLYMHFENVRFIIHSHTYIEGAPFTENVVPCGALEELPEIMAVVPKGTTKSFVNLEGHGSLAMAADWNDLKDIGYVARTIPEDQT